MPASVSEQVRVICNNDDSQRGHCGLPIEHTTFFNHRILQVFDPMASPTKQGFSKHEPYSNLEVAPTEHATQAPQILLEPAATAPERDFTAESPELDKKPWPLPSLSVRT